MAGLQLHERTMLVQKASNDFQSMSLDWMQKHDLTYGEVIGIFADRLGTIAKYMVRSERHPDDPEKRGDEA